MVILTRRWRERDLQRRMEVWRPLIGERATITATRGRWWMLAGVCAGLGFVATSVILGVLARDARIASASVDVAGALIYFGLIPSQLILQGRGARLLARASREAALIAGTSPKARPPVLKLQQFEAWQRRGKYVRNSDVPFAQPLTATD